MGRIVRHMFKYEKAILQSKRQLLCKYYPNTEIKVKLDNKIIGEGTMNLEFLEEIINRYGSTSDNFVIETGRVWSQLASIQTMAPFKPLKGPAQIFNEPNKIIDLHVKINDLIDTRKSYGVKDIGLISPIKADNFNQLVFASQYLNNESITQLYVAPVNKVIYIVINELHVIKVTQNIISDGELPPFDLDLGFVGTVGDELCHELNQEFKNWCNKFEVTNGQSWNDPILINRLPDIVNYESGRRIY